MHSPVRDAMKTRSIFFCTECGNEYSNWNGQCPGCGAWSTLVEQPVEASPARSGGRVSGARVQIRGEHGPVALPGITQNDALRFPTGLSELDRVLGGGAVLGSVVLVGGEPGIGKSTLLLQICSALSRDQKILYVTGEESPQQVKLRAQRLGLGDCPNLYIFPETDAGVILDAVDKLSPGILIVDSIQTIYTRGLAASAGNVAQVKECTLLLMELAKTRGITVFVVGHVNKEGAIAGPKVLEHMVDCVLYFEGDRQLSCRVLRAAKNRFGSTNEIGMFDMQEKGLVEVPNPSEFLLEGRPLHAPGTCVACVMEGARPVLAEVQALIAKSSFGTPRRMVSGLDHNRAMLLLAVLEKRTGLFVGGSDAYINIVGGLEIDEPAVDLPVLLACASSVREVAIREQLCALGEVGLTGELRAVSGLRQRLTEIRRMGFTHCVIPKQGTKGLADPDGLTLLRVSNVREAFSRVFD